MYSLFQCTYKNVIAFNKKYQNVGGISKQMMLELFSGSNEIANAVKSIKHI